MAKGDTPNWLFAVAHPVQALRTKVRQVEVAIEHAQPPRGSSIEEFPKMNLASASESLGREQMKDWPERDVDLMLQGRLPRPGSHPEHPNI